MGEKRYSVLIEGKPVEGTAETIMTVLSEKNFFVKYDSISEFIEKATRDIWRLYGIGITVNGNTIEEKSQSLLEQLISHNLLREQDSIPSSLEIALEKSEKTNKVYLVGWINNMMQRRLLYGYPGETLKDKYESAKKDFGEDVLSFEFPDGEAIWVKVYN